MGKFNKELLFLEKGVFLSNKIAQMLYNFKEEERTEIVERVKEFVSFLRQVEEHCLEEESASVPRVILSSVDNDKIPDAVMKALLSELKTKNEEVNGKIRNLQNFQQRLSSMLQEQEDTEDKI